MLYVQNERPIIRFDDVRQPLFTSGSKFSHGCDVPEELQGLSIAEQALISRVQCVMTHQHTLALQTLLAYAQWELDWLLQAQEPTYVHPRNRFSA